MSSESQAAAVHHNNSKKKRKAKSRSSAVDRQPLLHSSDDAAIASTVASDAFSLTSSRVIAQLPTAHPVQGMHVPIPAERRRRPPELLAVSPASPPMPVIVKPRSRSPALPLVNGVRAISSPSADSQEHVLSLLSEPIILIESRFQVAFRVVLSGVGFACDAYDLFIMNLVLVVLGCAEYDGNSSSLCYLSAGNKSLLATAVLLGSIAGQLVFGALADYFGRRKCFIATLSILILGAALSAASVSTPLTNIFWSLAIARAILGIGTGGEYPLAASQSSEASVQSEGRGQRVALVFSMQGVGLIIAPCVILLLTTLLDSNFQLIWRLALGLGGFPALLMLYSRFRLPETAVFIANAANAKDSREKWADLKHHWLDVISTTGNWALFDIVFYSNSLFSSQIIHTCTPSAGQNSCTPHEYIISLAFSTLLLALCAMPGYFVACLLIDRIGRRMLQLLGFCGMTISYAMCGLALPVLVNNPALFYFAYGLTFFFCNAPNVTTFVIPVEIFPTSIRASCHGLSAACGKLGAALGTALMPALLSQTSLSVVMYFSAGVSLLGALLTYFITRESQHINSLIDDESGEEAAVIVKEQHSGS